MTEHDRNRRTTTAGEHPNARSESVLTPTEVRQASPRLTNLRVLIASLVTLGVIGAGLLAAFYATSSQPVVPVANPPDRPSEPPASATPYGGQIQGSAP